MSDEYPSSHVADDEPDGESTRSLESTLVAVFCQFSTLALDSVGAMITHRESSIANPPSAERFDFVVENYNTPQLII
jgi:hypothetical protein